MNGTTKDRLVTAAAALMDKGGQTAVTLRAVAEAVGVSHNAPYRHFKDRNALLAGVAERDFKQLSCGFRTASEEDSAGVGGPLKAAAMTLITYARAHPARYHLLFSDPDFASVGGSPEIAALDAFGVFSAIVGRCQVEGMLPQTETAKLTGLIYATLHGSIDLELGGRAKERKGLGDIESTLDLLLDVLRRNEASSVSSQDQSTAYDRAK